MHSDDPIKELTQKQQQRTPTIRALNGDTERKHETRLDLAEISLRESDRVFLPADLFPQGLIDSLESLHFHLFFFILVAAD